MWDDVSVAGAKEASGWTRSIFLVRRNEDTLLDCWCCWGAALEMEDGAVEKRVKVGTRDETLKRHCSTERGLRRVHCIVVDAVGWLCGSSCCHCFLDEFLKRTGCGLGDEIRWPCGLCAVQSSIQSPQTRPYISLQHRVLCSLLNNFRMIRRLYCRPITVSKRRVKVSSW